MQAYYDILWGIVGFLFQTAIALFLVVGLVAFILWFVAEITIAFKNA